LSKIETGNTSEVLTSSPINLFLSDPEEPEVKATLQEAPEKSEVEEVDDQS
jgi:hypothetical protein